VPWIGPGGEPGDHVELLEEAANHPVGVGLGAEPVELGHHSRERDLDVVDGSLRVVLTIELETALTLDELFAIEVCKAMKDRLGRRTGIGEETR
jgi:hypothetical protein